MPQAEDLCKEALEMDPECDVAIATLAQLSLQQGKISEAIDWFEKSAKLARTEVELTTAITCGSRRCRSVEFGATDFVYISRARRTRFPSAIVVPAGEPDILHKNNRDSGADLKIARRTTPKWPKNWGNSLRNCRETVSMYKQRNYRVASTNISIHARPRSEIQIERQRRWDRFHNRRKAVVETAACENDAPVTENRVRR